jgi:hypothetical protein
VLLITAAWRCSRHLLVAQWEINRRTIMKTILATIITLTVLTGITASANALDQRRAYDQVFSTGQGN